MSKKIFIASIIFGFFAASFSVKTPQAQALTSAEIQNSIQQLQQQIIQLQKQLTETQGATIAWCHDFNVNLKIEDSGDEVAHLHTALQKDGVWNVTGFGSNDFDEETASYVVAFQEKYASEILVPWGLKHGTGFIGKSTRTKLNALYGCKITTPTPTPPATTTPSLCHTVSPWSWDYCSSVCKCDAGEGDCDSNLECNTGYCALDVGAKYGQSATIDVCEEKQTTEVKSIIVISPNGGEKLVENNNYKIKWIASGVDKVNIEYGDGKSYSIIQNYPAALGEYSWTPKGIISQYQGFANNILTGADIRIGIFDASNGSVFDKSDNYFSIISAAATTCTDSDESKDYYTKGTVTDNGKTYTDYCMDSSLKEYFCLPISTLGLGGVAEENYTCQYGCGDGICLITATTAPSITVTSPNGGEQWEAGKTYSIAWTVNGVNESTPISVFATNEESDILESNAKCTNLSFGESVSTSGYGYKSIFCGTIKYFVGGNYKYSFTIPSSWEKGGKYKINVAVPGDSDYSDNYFSIVAAAANQPPTAPGIGPAPVKTSGKTGESIQYLFSSKDLDGGDGYSLTYNINWGDRTTESCTVSYLKDVREADCVRSHTWSSAGTYTVIVKAKDGKGAESPAAYLYVTIVSAGTTADCTDSDGRMDYYKKGTTVGLAANNLQSTDTDYCNGNTLIEWFCSGSVYRTNTNYVCSFGCQDGACKPGITVTSPDGAEEWTVGETKKISWQSGGIKYVRIYIYDDTISGSGSINYIYDGVFSADTGYYNWTIKQNQLPGGTSLPRKYKISISGLNKGTIGAPVIASDKSDNYFTIVAATPASCTYLSEGVQSAMGTTCGNAKYNSVYDLNKDKYIDEMDYGLILNKIKNEAWCNATKADNSNPCGVVCTDSDGGQDYYKKGIATGLNTVDLITTRTDECAGTTGQDLNEFYCYNSYIGSEVYECPFGCQDGACLITAPSVTVTSPNGEEAWQIGKTYEIKWVASGLSSVGINITDDSMNFATGIIDNLSPGTGSYSWTIPSSIAIGDKYKVLVGGQEVNDMSDNYFSIAAAATTTPTGFKNIEDQLASFSQAISQLMEKMKELITR